MTTVVKNGVRRRVLVSTMRTIPNSLLEKTKVVLERVGTVPIINFPLIYHSITKQIFDPEEFGMDTGLRFFLGQFENIELLYPDSLGPVVKLRNNYLPSFDVTQSIHDGGVEDKENNIDYLQQGLVSNQASDPDFDKFLTQLYVFKPSICVHRSPFEICLSRYPAMVESDLKQLKSLFDKYKNGIKLGQFSKLIHIDKWLYNLPSLEEIVTSCPEMFFYEEVRKDNPNERTLFYGITKTHSNLDGSKLRITPGVRSLLLNLTLKQDLYRKTILMMCSQGQHGLKLGVWSSSMKESFEFGPMELMVLDSSPLAWFLLLSSEHLIQIKSTESCMNDLRAFPPMNNTEELIKEILARPVTSIQLDHILSEDLDFYSYSLEEVALKITKSNYQRNVDKTLSGNLIVSGRIEPILESCKSHLSVPHHNEILQISHVPR